MATSRADLLEYLQGQIHSLALWAGQTETDTPEGYAYPLDSAFSDLGFPGSGQDPGIGDNQTELARTLAKYYALLKIWEDKASKRVNVSLDGIGRQDAIVFANLEKTLERTAKRCEALGKPVDGSGWSSGRILLDYLYDDPSEVTSDPW